MHPVLQFRSARFDMTAEPPNPYNPIAGHGVLAWLRGAVPELALSEPVPEDWGWCASAAVEGRRYLVGASLVEGATPEAEALWAVQIEKHRTLAERLWRRAPLTPDDPCLRLVGEALRSDPGIRALDIELGP